MLNNIEALTNSVLQGGDPVLNFLSWALALNTSMAKAQGIKAFQVHGINAVVSQKTKM
jgi:hypothetical protein